MAGCEQHCQAKLSLSCEQVIADIAKRMGSGMALHIEEEVLTVKDYDMYCHFVAGLVGHGLAKVP